MRDLRESKRARFAQPTSRPRRPTAIWLFAGVGVLAVGLLIWAWQGSSPSGATPGGDVSALDGVIRLPVSAFEDGQARFYTHQADGVEIEYFILKSSDGVIRAAFNACDVCFLAKQGYRQEGDEMVCNNCGQRFSSVLINEVRGGCNPSPLNRTVEGDQVVIRVDDILAGAKYF